MSSYISYNFQSRRSLETLEKYPEFVKLLNKIADCYDSHIRWGYGSFDDSYIHEFKNALNDVCFEKVLENHNDTLMARVYYDMPEDIISIERIYRQHHHYSPILDNFVNELILPFEEWISIATEVLEEPEILRIFLKIINLQERFEKKEDLIFTKAEIDSLVEDLKDYIKNGNEGNTFSIDYVNDCNP